MLHLILKCSIILKVFEETMKRLTYFFLAALLFTANLLALKASLVSAEPVNLIPNPSVETSNGSVPLSWANSKQGRNTAVFTYLNTGRTGNRSLEINMTQRSTGNARWYFSAVNVNPSTTYTYSDWYKSNKTTYLQPVITRTDGSITNMSQTRVPVSADW